MWGLPGRGSTADGGCHRGPGIYSHAFWKNLLHCVSLGHQGPLPSTSYGQSTGQGLPCPPHLSVRLSAPGVSAGWGPHPAQQVGGNRGSRSLLPKAAPLTARQLLHPQSRSAGSFRCGAGGSGQGLPQHFLSSGACLVGWKVGAGGVIAPGKPLGKEALGQADRAPGPPSPWLESRWAHPFPAAAHSTHRTHHTPTQLSGPPGLCVQKGPVGSPRLQERQVHGYSACHSPGHTRLP